MKWLVDPPIETVVISPEQVERAFALLAQIVDAYHHDDLPPSALVIERLLCEVRDANIPINSEIGDNSIGENDGHESEGSES